MTRLTPKQHKFIDEYLIDLNGTQAAIRAGYRENTARQMAAQNLSKPVIQQKIQERREELSRQTKVTQERILEEEAAIAFCDPREVFGPDGNLLPLHEIPEQMARALASVDRIETTQQVGGIRETTVRYRYRFWDKGKSLERLGKHLGMFTDRMRFEGKIEIENQFALLSDEVLLRLLQDPEPEVNEQHKTP